MESPASQPTSDELDGSSDIIPVEETGPVELGSGYNGLWL